MLFRSLSTPEAEVVAANFAMKNYGVPCLDLWEHLLGRSVVVPFHEDNSTAISAMRHGYSPNLRHVKRTHGVCIRWLSHQFRRESWQLLYERSALQAADVFTKAFTVPGEWDRVTRLINHVDPQRFWGGPDKWDCKAGEMGDAHKGDVHFTYWTSVPWAGREPQAMPGPQHGEETPSAADASAMLCMLRRLTHTHNVRKRTTCCARIHDALTCSDYLDD